MHSLNIRGAGKTGRKQYLADLIAKNKLEFVGIQETKCVKFSVQYLSFISSHSDFSWVELPANKTAGGILAGFRNDLFDILGYKQ